MHVKGQILELHPIFVVCRTFSKSHMARREYFAIENRRSAFREVSTGTPIEMVVVQGRVRDLEVASGCDS